ncbi:TonB-linked outer membrane protein, SusC/RagA family [Mucilaginibacter sp. OK268]|uniref:SusC/RagA family TonB-linked outer membrane protein n=1 Tax=Mucilaginibacter sp. OK268 TaxID=1881048 RepID=UPI00088F972D|nr:SusC/RagA family TonB-linked outer membrane protein [Mucilaginibacter sp. OK268]SDQ01702.1 TonB-linked outer membrane protein, SusC/RagA family [Mucilaginibacter sp. OK268]
MTKCTLLLIVISSFQVFSKGYGQDKININLHNVSIKKALAEVEKASSYRFVYNDDALNSKLIGKIDLSNATIVEVMDMLLSQTDLTYKLNGNNLVIITDKKQQTAAISISGVVSDAKGPLPGVSVKLKGTQVGVLTDGNGKYLINVPDNNATLVFSSVGYVSTEIVVGDRKSINVTLKESATDLSEVVVTGYGQSVAKRDLTGAISTVTAKQIEERHPINLIDALQSQASGVLVINDSGEPGATGSIQIRGGSTFSSAGNSPLFVIDGILSQSADNVNPNDIQSIEVLKDAASAAIYGSQAANGVILITTKRGKPGKPLINAQYARIFGVMAHKLEQPNSRDLRIERNLYNGASPDKPTTTNDSLNVVFNSDNDNQDVITQTAKRDILDFGVSGGEKSVQYYSSIRYINDLGLIVNSYAKTLQARFNLDYQVSPRFKYSNRLSFGYNTNNNINEGNTINQAFQRPSNLALYYPDGTLTGYISGRRNQLSVALLEINQTNTYTGDLFNQIDYTITKDLRLTNNFDFGLSTPHNVFFDPKLLSSASPLVNSGRESFAVNTNWAYQGFLNWAKTFGNHSITAVAGVSAEKTQNNNFKIAGSNSANETIYTSNVYGTIDQTNTGTDAGSTSRESLYARATYNYKSRYMFNVVYRKDGSSRFGKDNKYGDFYGSSAAWRFTDEPFMGWAKKFLNDAKLRVNYGEVGNDRIPSNSNLLIYTFGSSFYNAVNGVVLSNQFGNSQLKWESNIQKGIGLDLQFFNSRLNVTADYYQKTTKNLLYQRNIPVETGFTNVYVNVGDVTNKGFELSINATPLALKNFNWNIGANLTIERNRIKSLYNHQPFLATSGGATYLVQEGGKIGDFYGYKGLGVYQYDASNAYDGNWNRLTPVGVSADGKTAQNYTLNGQTYSGTVHHMYAGGALLLGGDMIFDNVKKDSVIDANDRQVLGNAQPSFYASIINTINYKQFTLSFTLNTTWGGQIYDSPRQTLDNLATSGIVADNNTTYNSWKKQGDITDIPYMGRKNSTANFPGTQTRFLENSSFIRLSYAKLTYNLPANLASRYKLKNIGAYVYGANLLTWTNYTWYDPEFSSSSALTPGNDNGRYPRRREVGFGINVNF